VKQCRQRGVRKIAITDHNTADGALVFAKLEPALIIPGEEIMTTEGEILAFFVKETVPKGLTPADTIQRLREQAAFISVSHPFDRHRKGAWTREQLDRIITLVDAIEVYNARCIFNEDNARAAEYAAKHSIAGTVGSDAHIPYEIGKATLLMPPFDGRDSFAEALKAAQQDVRLSPAWVHGFSMLAKWQRKYGKRPQPLKSGNQM
jgi:predicted metal-dependent phosphoesterase TrpH